MLIGELFGLQEAGGDVSRRGRFGVEGLSSSYMLMSLSSFSGSESAAVRLGGIEMDV